VAPDRKSEPEWHKEVEVDMAGVEKVGLDKIEVDKTA
jgi:hypothetical protein